MASSKFKNNILKSAGLLFEPATLYFTVPFLLFFSLGGIYILIGDKGSLVMALNAISGEKLDVFFLWVTRIGLGSIIAVLGALLVFYRFRWSLLTFVNLALVGIFTNLFKRVFFHLSSRPLHYFYYDDFPRFLYDAPLTYYNTFPSGHTMTIYAACSLMAILINRKMAGILLFILAFLVGISRIYLLQHFFLDTWAGAILGILATIITFMIDEKFRLSKRKFADLNLFRIFLKK